MVLTRSLPRTTLQGEPTLLIFSEAAHAPHGVGLEGAGGNSMALMSAWMSEPAAPCIGLGLFVGLSRRRRLLRTHAQRDRGQPARQLRSRDREHDRATTTDQSAPS